MRAFVLIAILLAELSTAGVTTEGLRAEELRTEELRTEELGAEGLKSGRVKVERLRFEGSRAKRLRVAEALKRTESLRGSGLRFGAEKLRIVDAGAEKRRADELRAEGLREATGGLRETAEGLRYAAEGLKEQLITGLGLKTLVSRLKAEELGVEAPGSRKLKVEGSRAEEPGVEKARVEESRAEAPRSVVPRAEELSSEGLGAEGLRTGWTTAEQLNAQGKGSDWEFEDEDLGVEELGAEGAEGVECRETNEGEAKDLSARANLSLVEEGLGSETPTAQGQELEESDASTQDAEGPGAEAVKGNEVTEESSPEVDGVEDSHPLPAAEGAEGDKEAVVGSGAEEAKGAGPDSLRVEGAEGSEESEPGNTTVAEAIVKEVDDEEPQTPEDLEPDLFPELIPSVSANSDCAEMCEEGTCSGHGTCELPSCECLCVEGYTGQFCDEKVTVISNFKLKPPPKPCPDNCSGQGFCNQNGTCTCDKGWAGYNCLIECAGGAANPCAGHGTCHKPDGKCICDEGYAGKNCTRRAIPQDVNAYRKQVLAESEPQELEKKPEPDPSTPPPLSLSERQLPNQTKPQANQTGPVANASEADANTTSGQAKDEGSKAPEFILGNVVSKDDLALLGPNHASFDLGAKALASNKDANGEGSLLRNDRDKYWISPCKVEKGVKWVVIELNEIIYVHTIVLGSFEYYSSTIKTFQVLGQLSYPTDHWNLLGQFQASNSRQLQIFPLKTKRMAKYLKIRLLTHFGNEFYCTLSSLKVYGTTQWEEMGRMLDENEEVVEQTKRRLDGVEEKQNETALTPEIEGANQTNQDKDSKSVNAVEGAQKIQDSENATADELDEKPKSLFQRLTSAFSGSNLPNETVKTDQSEVSNDSDNNTTETVEAPGSAHSQSESLSDERSKEVLQGAHAHEQQAVNDSQTEFKNLSNTEPLPEPFDIAEQGVVMPYISAASEHEPMAASSELAAHGSEQDKVESSSAAEGEEQASQVSEPIDVNVPFRSAEAVATSPTETVRNPLTVHEGESVQAQISEDSDAASGQEGGPMTPKPSVENIAAESGNGPGDSEEKESSKSVTLPQPSNTANSQGDVDSTAKDQQDQQTESPESGGPGTDPAGLVEGGAGKEAVSPSNRQVDPLHSSTVQTTTDTHHLPNDGAEGADRSDGSQTGSRISEGDEGVSASSNFSTGSEFQRTVNASESRRQSAVEETTEQGVKRPHSAEQSANASNSHSSEAGAHQDVGTETANSTDSASEQEAEQQRAKEEEEEKRKAEELKAEEEERLRKEEEEERLKKEEEEKLKERRRIEEMRKAMSIIPTPKGEMSFFQKVPAKIKDLEINQSLLQSYIQDVKKQYDEAFEDVSAEVKNLQGQVEALRAEIKASARNISAEIKALKNETVLMEEAWRSRLAMMEAQQVELDSLQQSMAWQRWSSHVQTLALGLLGCLILWSFKSPAHHLHKTMETLLKSLLRFLETAKKRHPEKSASARMLGFLIRMMTPGLGTKKAEGRIKMENLRLDTGVGQVDGLGSRPVVAPFTRSSSAAVLPTSAPADQLLRRRHFSSSASDLLATAKGNGNAVALAKKGKKGKRKPPSPDETPTTNQENVPTNLQTKVFGAPRSMLSLHNGAAGHAQGSWPYLDKVEEASPDVTPKLMAESPVKDRYFTGAGPISMEDLRLPAPARCHSVDSAETSSSPKKDPNSPNRYHGASSQHRQSPAQPLSTGSMGFEPPRTNRKAWSKRSASLEDVPAFAKGYVLTGNSIYHPLQNESTEESEQTDKDMPDSPHVRFMAQPQVLGNGHSKR